MAGGASVHFRQKLAHCIELRAEALQLLASQPAGRKARRTTSEALLMGKLYDDRGNRMSPSFSAKNGVHYRLCVPTT